MNEQEMREALRQDLDEAVLMRTGRSVGDIASGRVVDDLWPTIRRIVAAELRAAADELWSPTGGCDGIKLDVSDMLRARADALDPQ